MKYKGFFSWVAVLLFLGTLLAAEEVHDSSWYPFSIARSLDPGSTANVGKILLDAPAGKHGFVKLAGSGFLFEQGQPARFWGTNLCFNACFPGKLEAENIASRLAFFGFNAVRLHHMDFFSEPRGIFADSNSASDNPQAKSTQKLSEAQLDRLDYLIYQLKLRGIYVDINLLVARHFTLMDGVADADKLGMAAKPVSYFDPKLIELQKKYAKDLLTHTNPYTKLRTCDDPAIAFVEITNENSLFDFWQWNRLNGSFMGLKKNSLPAPYVDELDKRWNKWLEEKYKSVEKTSTVGFMKRTNKPLFDFERPLYKTRSFHSEQSVKDIQMFYTDVERAYFDEMIRFLKNEVGVKVPITGIGGFPQKEDVTAQKSCDYIDTHTYWDHPQFPKSGWDRDNFTIKNKSLLSNLGEGMAAGIQKNDPGGGKPYTISEWNHCYPNSYAYEAPVLMASEAVKYKWAALYQFAFSHGWESAPSLDSIQSYFDILANAQQLLLHSVASFIFHKVTDATVTVQDGILNIHSEKIKGAAGSIKGKPQVFQFLTFTASENGAVFLYSPEDKPLQESSKILLIVVGEIKNKGSGWKNKTFDWGSSPTLLKKMDLQVAIALGKPFKIYELDTEGKRGNAVKASFEDGVLSFSTTEASSPWFELEIVS